MTDIVPTTTPASVIPADVLQTVTAAVDTLVVQLVPLLDDLGTGDRRSMPRMGDKTEAFVSKSLSYARAKPEYCPGYIDIEHFQSRVDALVAFRGLQRPLSQVMDMLSDSIALAGSEAYDASLAFYQQVKAAAKRNQPGAATMNDDLSARFAAQSRPRKPSKPKSPPTAPPAVSSDQN